MIYTLNLSDRQAGALFAYLFSLLSTSRYKQEVPNGYRLKQDVIDKSGYILKNCKLYAYRYHYLREQGRKLPNYKAYGIHENDVHLLQRLNLKAIDTNRYKAATVETFDRAVISVLQGQEFQRYLRAFVRKKFTFLVRSCGDSYSNIKSHLTEQALYHLYRTYPYFDTKLHMLNVAKRAAHNSGIDYIRHKTTQKNRRLFYDGSGYVAVNVNIEELHNLLSSNEGRMAVPCLSNFKFSKRAQAYLDLVQGKYNAEFSEHLGFRNDEYALSISFKEYKKKVESYLGLSERHVNSLFEKIRAAKF